MSEINIDDSKSETELKLRAEIAELKRQLEFNQRRAVQYGNANNDLVRENWLLTWSVAGYQRHAMQWVLNNVEPLKKFMGAQRAPKKPRKKSKRVARKR